MTSVSEANIAGAGADDASIGTFTWSNPGNITAKDGSYALVAGGASHFLKATSFGFSIPSGATIKGISVAVTRRSTNLDVVDEAIRLVKAGTVQTTDRAVGTAWPTTFTDQVYGGPTDLWGGTWAYTDINNSGFGAAVAANVTPPDGAEVDAITITVYYTLASGFTVTQDAVVYANQNVHLRHDGMWREAPSGTVYGPVSNVTGDLCRLPPSGIENRPCQVLVKPSRGDLNTLPDSGLDGFTVQVRYRPSWIFRP